MDKSIVYQGKTNDGRPLIIRYPQEGDAQILRDYINTLSSEQSFIRFQGEQVSIEFETKYLHEQLEKIEKKMAVLLFAFVDSVLIGNSGIEMKDRVEAHEGVFGISIAKNCRGQGIGKLLMQTVLEEAIKQIPQLKIVTLSVFANNKNAYQMYKNFGFVEYGMLPKGIICKGEYIDHIYLYKNVKEL